MALKLRTLNYRPWPVTVKLQECDAAGNVVEVEQTFVVHWKPINEEGREALSNEMRRTFGPKVDAAEPVEGKKPETPEPPERVTNAEVLNRNAWFFERRVMGWGPEVQDESGQPLQYSPEVLRNMLTGDDGYAFCAAFAEADSQIRYGIAPTKNSKTSPVPGDAPGAGEAATS